MATVDGKYLQYGSNVKANGIDKLLEDFNDDGQEEAEPTANIFLYGNATKVANVPASNVHVSINENAVLLQSSNDAFINTTVGITFDNSCKSAKDYYNHDLTYDWHLMSSPLTKAPMGIEYQDTPANWWQTGTWGEWWTTGDAGQVASVSGSYMPDGIDAQSDVLWDLYAYDEPNYHWINFKRNSDSHYHFDSLADGSHQQITYNNEEYFIPGKGYMMAISQDSYLNNTGTLNNGNVPIKLTKTAQQDPDWEGFYDQGSNLIGNPYQAYLDLSMIPNYDRFYVYVAEEDQYVPFTKGQSENTWTPSRFIHPHQAFFVLTDADDADFKFTYDMAVDTMNNESYFRKGAQINYPLINLFVNNDAGARNYTIIEVGRPELGGAERSRALTTTDFDLYSHYEQKDFKLLFTPAEAQRVAVFFTAKTDGKYTLTWDTQNGEFSFLRLIDNITGTECDMLSTDHYTFDAQKTDFASRFYILFNNPNEEPGNNSNDDGNGNFAYYDGYGWIINGEGILQLVDVTGRVLYSKYLAGDMNRVHLDNFKTGVYVLQLGGKTQKIIIK